MQTILGAGGDVGFLLAKELKIYTDKVRLVARTPKKVNGNDELFKADLLNEDEVQKAIAGSDVVYLTVGLTYDVGIWKRQWPAIMENVIKACRAHNCKLVFFDNVYAYDKTSIPNMREDSAINPPSEKGKVRAQLLRMIHDAIATKGLKALVARSADFYGPGAKNGILNILVVDRMTSGKKANWQSSANKVHSFTYVPDAAKAVALLGNTESAYNQTWHLPTSPERLTGKQFIEIAGKLTGRKPSHFLLTPFILSLAGLFSKTIKELKEMQYQNAQEYFFNSEKFCKAFNFTPTSYEEGLRQTVAAAKE